MQAQAAAICIHEQVALGVSRAMDYPC